MHQTTNKTNVKLFSGLSEIISLDCLLLVCTESRSWNKDIITYVKNTALFDKAQKYGLLPAKMKLLRFIHTSRQAAVWMLLKPTCLLASE